MGHEIRSEQVREVITGAPHELVVAKDTSVITESNKRYIDRSPFVCLATHGADGSSDVSPRGDAPGRWATAPKRSVAQNCGSRIIYPTPEYRALLELMSDHLGLDAATSEMLERGIDDDVRSNVY